MLDTLDPFEQSGHVVELDPLPQTEVVGLDTERLGGCAGSPLQTDPESVVHDHLQWPAAAPHLPLEGGCHVVVEGQGRSGRHIKKRIRSAS